MTYTELVTITWSQIVDLDDLCCGMVTRDGQVDSCDKPATTVLYDAESGTPWPACSWHANRCGGGVTLAQISGARLWGAVEFEREVTV